MPKVLTNNNRSIGRVTMKNITERQVKCLAKSRGVTLAGKDCNKWLSENLHLFINEFITHNLIDNE